MTDLAWIDAALTSARPQAVGALLRYFRDLDTAEEAFQDACLRALKNWPQNGPPRDPAAWLIFVGRNAAIDAVRRRRKQEPLPDEELISDLERRRSRRWPSGSTARTIATTSCGCCSSAAIPTCRRRSRSRWRCASSPASSVKQIARAFLVERERDGAAHHARQGAHRAGRRAVRGAGRGGARRAARGGRGDGLSRVQRGLFGERRDGRQRAPLCDEAIRLARLLLRLFPAEPEIMGLAALLLLQHARAPARFDADGAIVLLEDQDRSLWNRAMIAEGARADRQGDAPSAPGPLSDAGGDRGAACARRAARRHRLGARSTCSTRRSNGMQPSPVVTLNRAVAVSKVAGPAAALAMIEPLAPQLSGYFHFFGVQGRAAHAARPRARRRATPSTAPSRSPTPRRKPRISGCISTGSPRRRPDHGRENHGGLIKSRSAALRIGEFGDTINPRPSPLGRKQRRPETGGFHPRITAGVSLFY